MAEEFITQAETFHQRKLYIKVYEILKEAYSKFPTDPEVVWRFARANYEFAEERPVDLQLREQHFKRSAELGAEALKLKDDSAQIHKWYAICLAGADEFASQQDKIAHAFDIKQHALKALELDPNPDWLSYYVLGRWCLSVANVGWIERKLAQSIYQNPPESSYEEALSYFKKAHEKDPKDLGPVVHIGDTYYAMKNWTESKAWYTKATELPVLCVNDGVLKGRAQQQLTTLTGY